MSVCDTAIDGAAVREQLRAAGLLLAASDVPPRQRPRAAAAWRIDADGLASAALHIFRHERALIRHVIEQGDPRVAAVLRRLVERERLGARVA